MKSFILIKILSLSFILLSFQTSFSQTQKSKPKKSAILTSEYWLSKAEGNQFITQNAMAAAMIPRCQNAALMSYNDIQSLAICQIAVWNLFKQLDATSITLNLTGKPRAFTVAFKTEMLKVLNEPKTMVFLNALFQDRDFQMLFPKSTVSIAQVAQKIYVQRPQVIRVMATLFQNTSTVMAHIDWLETKKKTMTSLQKMTLQKLKAFYQQMSFDRIDRRVSYEYLAADMMTTGLTAMDSYHFYVPAFLFLQTHRKLKNNAWATWLAAYFFNYIYEIVTDPSTRKNYFFDPKKLDKPGTLKDIYAGYYSISYLLQLNPKQFKTLSLKEFSLQARTDNRKLESNILGLSR